MRRTVLPATLFALTLTTLSGPAQAGKLMDWVAPARVSRTADGGLRVSTYGKHNGQSGVLIKQEIDHPAGDGVKSYLAPRREIIERQTHKIDGAKHDVLVETLKYADGRTVRTTHFEDGIHRDTIKVTQGNKAPGKMTMAGAWARAAWASPVTRIVAYTGLLGTIGTASGMALGTALGSAAKMGFATAFPISLMSSLTRAQLQTIVTDTTTR